MTESRTTESWPAAALTPAPSSSEEGGGLVYWKREPAPRPQVLQPTWATFREEGLPKCFLSPNPAFPSH